MSFASCYCKMFPHLEPHDSLGPALVPTAVTSTSKPRSQPQTSAPASLQAAQSWGLDPVPPQHARATAAVEQDVPGARAEGVGWGVVGLGGGGGGGGRAAAGGSGGGGGCSGSGKKGGETDRDHQMAQAVQRDWNSLRATRVKPASTSKGVLGAPLGSSGFASSAVAAAAAASQHPSSSAARYDGSDSDDENLAARCDRYGGGGGAVQQEQELSQSQEPQTPCCVTNQAWEGTPVSCSDDDEDFSQSKEMIEEQLEREMQDEVCASVSPWRFTCRLDTPSPLHAVCSRVRRRCEQNSDDEEPFAKPNESICCACDDGGDLLMCDSVCMRSFHRMCVGLHKAEFLKIKVCVCSLCALRVLCTARSLLAC